VKHKLPIKKRKPQHTNTELAKSKKPQHNDATQTLFPSKQHVKDPTKIQNTNTRRSYTESTTAFSNFWKFNGGNNRYVKIKNTN
jgi:hypothetical protein